MFQTLETTWDRSGRRRWSTLASFTMQSLALSLLLAVPMMLVQGPPRFRWIDSSIFSPPAGPAPPAARTAQRAMHGSQMRGDVLLQTPTIPIGIAHINDGDTPPAPGMRDIGAGGTRVGDGTVPGSIGNPMAISPPAPPKPTQPIRVSQMAEGNLAYRMQPAYPPLARQARIQGEVRLRAIISRTGTIENLAVLNGHALLIPAAIEAVRQWRYRPYILNGEPIEVETEITVNFVLGGG